MSRHNYVPNRQTINRLERVMNEFRKAYDGMSVDQAMTLLWIAAEPGSTQVEIGQRAGITRPAISRHVEVLGPPRVKLGKKVGQDLVTNDYSDEDHRKKVLRLTPSGERIVRSIEHLMSN